MDPPGGDGSGAGSHRPSDNDLYFCDRSGKRDAPRGSGPQRARETQRAARRELAGLVRSLHGGRAGRNEAADVSAYRPVTSNHLCFRLQDITTQEKDTTTTTM